MKTLLPIPDWWFFHVEGHQAPWDVSGTYSDSFLFALALKCFLGRADWTGDRYSEIMKCIVANLENPEDEDTLTSLCIILNVKWSELVDYFTELDKDLNTGNTTIAPQQPFRDVLLVDLPDRCVEHIATGRIIFPRKPPIDMQ